ncbi:hypothetical protein RBH26_11335 [Natronolimnohabitans sp. A-GB9]|uniref:hypothetical protein n=1 Tax=Natronolimnohabitans sp. A-GB9 TaxID=3069757 RepID=UPI0027B26B43|nr:hypothetical protein [Natronolimnohabitans sp. A-GB9]MDQ2051073.1 hypothetical protein [Natronolimnohabitans sp. A-GB9]
MVNRRTFVGAVCTTAVLAGCLGDDTDDGDDGDDGDTDDETEADSEDEADLEERIEEYDPVDRTGESSVHIQVAPDGEPRFDPDPVMVDSMAEIRWTGDSNYEIYPIDIPDGCQWSGVEDGADHEWQFPFEGAYELGCRLPDGAEFTGMMFVV